MPSIDEILLLSEEASTGERRRSNLPENEVQIRYVRAGFWGILWAGAAYPLVAGSVLVVPSLIASVQRVSVPQVIMEAFVWFVFFVLLFGACGFVVSAFMAVFSIPLVIFINHLFGNRLSPRSATICAGSLAGYIPMSFLLLVPPYLNQDPFETAMSISLGPVLSMSLCAFGAAYSSAKYARVRSSEIETKKKPLLIAHLMIATALIAVVLAIGNFFGGTGFMICVGFWCGVQMLMLAVVHLYRRCFGREPAAC